MRIRWQRWLAWWIGRAFPVDGDLWTKRGPLARKRTRPGRLEPGGGGYPRPARQGDPYPPFAA